MMSREIRTKIAKMGLCLVVALLACSVTKAQDVTSNSMPGTDFTKYHTYKWVAVEGASHPNQIVDTQIKASIDSQLGAKGLTKTNSDKADLYIDYQVSVNQQKQWNAYGTGMGFRFGGGMATATSSTIDIGTLVLDMYDPASKQLVWSGRATKTIDPNNSQEKKQKNLDKAMQKLLKNYPPK
ncbi:MAG: DUF4136 domain-containing protein [Candidatus Acidiferrales bacterium]